MSRLPGCHESAAGTPFAFQDIARFVTYYEQDGWLEARTLYRDLPAGARDATRAGPGRVEEACQFQTDYPEIIRRAEHYFA